MATSSGNGGRVRVEFNGDELVIEWEDEFDLEMVRAQLYSITDIEPCDQCFDPALSSGSNVVHSLTRRHAPIPVSDDLEANLVLESIPLSTSCTRTWIGATSVKQPGMQRDGTMSTCYACSTACCKPADLKPRPQFRTAFSCECSPCLFKSRVDGGRECLVDPYKGIVVAKLARDMLDLESAMKAQGHEQMKMRLESNRHQVMDFEDPQSQQKARQIIPLETLLARGKERGNDALPGRDELLFQLLAWFKHEFFRWVNSPPCTSCGSTATASFGQARPNADEAKYRAGIVELHRCSACQTVIRFPRYNHSGKLMETKSGRCGEWAQAFTLCCRALSFEARFVSDWTDHVWTEVWSDSKARFMHCDPCENAMDNPYMYEAGWNKKLNYIIAFSVDGQSKCPYRLLFVQSPRFISEVRDVTRRYTRQYDDDVNGVMSRRMNCNEDWLEDVIRRYNTEISARQPAAKRLLVAERWQKEKDCLFGCAPPPPPVTETLQQGRQTGSLEWRAARGELGTNTVEAVPAAPAPALAPANDDAKLKLQQLIKQYYVQLTKGCGSMDCTNTLFCLSAPGFPVKTESAPKERLQQAIKVVQAHGSAKLCAASHAAS